MRSALPCLLLIFVSCRDPNTRRVEMPPPEATCGDGVIQEGEDCDGSAAGEATCVTLGFETGRVVCTDACQYSTALCVKRCGNGVLDVGETCDGTLGLTECTTWGFNACSETCTIDTRRCVATAPFEAGPEMPASMGGRAVLGDLAPTGPGDLVMVVPSFERVEIVPWNMTRGFEVSASRKLSFQRTPRFAEILDANGDGTTDVATINADGSFDLILGGSSYSLTPLDGGCASGAFLPSDGTARPEAIVTGCDQLQTLTSAGVTSVPAASLAIATRGPHGVVWADTMNAVHFSDGGTFMLTAAPASIATADLEGDGDEDLAALTGSGIQLFENTGSGFALRDTIAGAFGRLRLLDLDGDGRADLFWVDGATLVVRRNNGAFTFTETRIPAGTGPQHALAFGDADGDQDLDIALTILNGGEATTTRTFMNRVR